MEQKREMPAFASEGEEAKWWFDHRKERDSELAIAIDSGNARKNFVHTLLHQQEMIAPQTITLNSQDALEAARLAQQKGMEVQAYLNDLLHDALQREREQTAA